MPETEDARHLPVNDPALGEVSLDERVGSYCATVTIAGRPIWVCLEVAQQVQAARLLPIARTAVSRFDQLHADGVGYLWNWGAQGDETAGERDAFVRSMVPTSLVVQPSGDVQIHFQDTDGRYFLDGYWPAVGFGANMTPMTVTIEA